jgi:glucose-6-phosphate 1-dehydrogenase
MRCLEVFCIGFGVIERPTVGVCTGASGDLARKKTYPSLFFLHKNKFLPKHTKIIGYARSPLTDAELRDRLAPTLKGSSEELDSFLDCCTYVSGPYDTDDGFKKLEEKMRSFEAHYHGCRLGRLYYLALPPTVYPVVCRGLKTHCDGITLDHDENWIRVIIEKPFGSDTESSEALAEELGELYSEHEIYRIDHYLGKEMLQNLFVLRFSNGIFSSVWSRDSIASVQITFKEDFGTQGRGGYFDNFGIIRDMIATHLSQILAFVAMEKPSSLHPDDIRDEKLKLLRSVRPVEPKDCVLGQYVGNGDEPGYLEDPTVPDGSRTPTFASMVLRINNDRWAGVPFIIKAGKALNERKADIRIQLHQPPMFIFPGDSEYLRNEIVVRLQPDEAIYAKIVVKSPGLDMGTEMSELDLDYRRRFPGVVIPDAYSRLILEAIRGDQQHFLRRDELKAAWNIFTPLLKKIDQGKVPVHEYEFGGRGPQQADDLLQRTGYKRPVDYTWSLKHLSVANADDV